MPGKPHILVIWIAFAFGGLGSDLSAQPTLQWQKALGGSSFDQAFCIRPTSDGGYIVVGTTYSTDGDVVNYHGSKDIWVTKLSITGDLEWSRTIGGSHEESGYTIRQTTDEGFILAGYTQSNDGDVTGNLGNKDAWVVKLTPTGGIEWQKTFGGSGWDEATAIEPTTDHGYIVAGRSNSTDGDLSGGHGYFDCWIFKLDEAGHVLWQRTYGGSFVENASAIKPTMDDGYVMVGESDSNDGDVAGSHGDSDWWILKIDSIGNIEWQKALGGIGLDVASDVVETNDAFVVCGYIGSNGGDITNYYGIFDAWVVKINKQGDVIWQKNYGGSDADYARGITATVDGNFIISGETKSKDFDIPLHNGVQKAWVMNLNPNGEKNWLGIYGGSDGEACFSHAPTPDNGLFFAGYAWSHDGDVSGVHGQSDFWVVKLAPESVGVRDLPENTHGQLQVSPNPADETIQINAAETVQLEVFDVFGRKMQAQTLLNGETMSVSDLPAGLYFVHAVGDSGQRLKGRILKQ